VGIDPYIVLGSAVIGFLVGMTGAGGGALMTPMLILLFGVKPAAAISSDLVARRCNASRWGLCPSPQGNGQSQACGLDGSWISPDGLPRRLSPTRLGEHQLGAEQH